MFKFTSLKSLNNFNTINIKRSISVKSKFNYGANNIAKIHFRANVNNLFLTLTDLKNRVVYTRSTGMCTQEKNKRQQLAPLVIKTMVNDMAKKIYRLKITRVEIIIRTRARRLFKNFMLYIRQNRIQISNIIDKRRMPHNGVRGKARTRK